MSSEDAEQSPPSDSLQEAVNAPQKKPKISYSRELLLSLAGSDACKKLPDGFDASDLIGLQPEGTSSGLLERHRSSGSLPSQGYRRGDNATPHGRADSLGGYSRGGSGRWDTRSTGSASSDKEGDSTEREPYGHDRRLGNQYRHHWQQTEHDGLLGSGAFARPPGFSGASTIKAHGGGSYQLNRTSEPYQPPRPYKGGSYTRKDHIDNVNDETFGSFESPGEDRTEEERKRRASFVMMRKEQQKVLQEKQKGGPDNKMRGDDIMVLLQNSVERDLETANSENLDQSVTFSDYLKDTARTNLIPPSTTTRPSVPPGFSGALAEKKSHLQSPSINIKQEVKSVVPEGNSPIDVRIRHQEVETSSLDNLCGNNVVSGGDVEAIGKHGDPSMTNVEDGGTEPKMPLNGRSRGDLVNSHLNEFEPERNTTSANQNNSVSILEKFFGSTQSKGTESSSKNIVSQDAGVAGDAFLSSSTSESSKFAHLFVEEGANPDDGLSSKNLLSMLRHENLNPDKSGLHAGCLASTCESILPVPSLSGGGTKSITPPVASDETLAAYREAVSTAPTPVFLTCEDLEQSMLAEVSSSALAPQHHVENEGESSGRDVKADDPASHLLLSLLRGTKSKESSPKLQATEANLPVVYNTDYAVPNGAADTAIARNTDIPAPGKSLTLEALFGAAFMKELHSTEAPVSERSAAVDVPSPDMPISDIPPYGNAEYSLPSSNTGNYIPGEHGHKNHTLDKAGVSRKMRGQEYGISPPNALGISNEGGDIRGPDIQLPEEDNLISVTDTLNAPNHSLTRKVDKDFQGKAVDEITYNFGNLYPQDAEHNSLRRDSGLSDPGGYDASFDNFHNLHFFQQGRIHAPHSMKDERSSFLRPVQFVDRAHQAGIVHQEAFHQERNHHMIPPVPQHGFDGPASSFDPAARFVLQQMAMSGNFSPQHLPQDILRGPQVPQPMQHSQQGGLPRGAMVSQRMHHLPQGLPRGVSVPQPVQHMASHVSDMGNSNSFHAYPQQFNPAYGMGLPGLPPASMRVQPDAYDGLANMEASSRLKQLPRPGMAAQMPGMHGPSLDMNIRYR